MSNDSLFHGNCGGSLSLWAGMVYCAKCGHIPFYLPPEIDSNDITVLLPYFIEADIIAETDFHGIGLKQI